MSLVAKYFTIFGIVYLGILMYIGYISFKKIGSGDDDYVLAGRQVPMNMALTHCLLLTVLPG